MAKRVASYECLECKKKFYTDRSAEKASSDGCPKCGGVDIDIYVETLARHPKLVHGRREMSTSHWLKY